jgi:hypothetical protein
VSGVPRAIQGASPTQLFNDRHRTDVVGGLEHRHNLAFLDFGKWIGTAPLARPSFLGRLPRIGLDGGAESNLRGGDGGRLDLTEPDV